MRRYGLRDDQWDRIKDLLPGREGSVGVTAADNRLFVEAVLYRYRAGIRGVICRNASVTGRTSSALQPLGQVRCLGEGIRAPRGRRRQRICDDRQHHRARSPAQRRRPKKAGMDQAIGRSRGGLTPKSTRWPTHSAIRSASSDRGRRTRPGRSRPPAANDEADTLVADKAFDADER